MVLVVLTLIVAGYSLFSLQQINLLNGQIVKVEVVIQESSDKMLDSLLAMDAYEKRFLVLGTDDMASLFQKRRKEFDSLLEGLQNLPRLGGARPPPSSRSRARPTRRFSPRKSSWFITAWPGKPTPSPTDSSRISWTSL